MLTLELPPEVEARLVEEAARRGLPVSEVIALLVQGYFWPAESPLLTEWYRQESRRGLFLIKSKETQIQLRERLVEAVTRVKNLESEIERQEREIARCGREAILAAQKGERAESLKAYQKQVLHEQRHGELQLKLPDAGREAEKLREELIHSEANVSRGMIELLRMKIGRNRADIYLARPTFPRSVEYEMETNIRNYASESVWNAKYEEWTAAHQDTVPEEVPSEIEVMNQVGEQISNFWINRLNGLRNCTTQTSPQNRNHPNKNFQLQTHT